MTDSKKTNKKTHKVDPAKDLFSDAYDKAQEAMASLIKDPSKPLPIDSAAGFLVSTASMCLVTYGFDVTDQLVKYVRDSLEKQAEEVEGKLQEQQ